MSAVCTEYKLEGKEQEQRNQLEAHQQEVMAVRWLTLVEVLRGSQNMDAAGSEYFPTG